MNPLYHGIYDLRETGTGQAVEDLNEEMPGTWIGTGTAETMAILMQSGVSSFSGVQTYPSKDMWDLIDPVGAYEKNWNRLGRIAWEVMPGAVSITNPSPDVILVTLDPCSEFAQRNADYVLSDVVGYNPPCLAPEAEVQQGTRTMRTFKIVPVGGHDKLGVF